MTNLLLKIPPVLLVDKDEIEVIPSAKFFVHLPECGCELKATEEKPNRDGLAYNVTTSAVVL